MNKSKAVIDFVVETYPQFCSNFTFKLHEGIKGVRRHNGGFGNCYWDPKHKLVYMHIDKCGSTSVTTAFDVCKKEFVKMDNLKYPELLAKHLVETNHTFFAIIRDPSSRWVSGLNEFMCRFKPPLEYVIKQVENKKYVFDEHTAPQHLFLKLCHDNNANVKYLKLNSEISDKINDVLKLNLTQEELENYKEVTIPHLRSSKYFIPNYTSICKKIYTSHVEENPTFFKELYKKDYELYDIAI